MASHCYQHKILNMANSMAWPLSSSAVACDLFSLSLCFHHFGILSVSSRILSSLPLQFFHMCFPIYLTHSTAFSSPGQLALILQVFILNVTFSGKNVYSRQPVVFLQSPYYRLGLNVFTVSLPVKTVTSVRQGPCLSYFFFCTYV